MTIPRPAADEYGTWYAGYVAAVAEGDVRGLLAAQLDETAGAFGGVSESQAGFRYAPGKWSIKEVAGHLADAERIFAYRTLRFARGDSTSLPGFDENAYVAGAGFDAQPLASLITGLADVRRATLSMVDSFDPSVFERRGTASGVVMSVRALVYVIAGHERHHLAVLRDRYLRNL